MQEEGGEEEMVEIGGVGGGSQRLVVGLKRGQGVWVWGGWSWASRSRWRR